MGARTIDEGAMDEKSGMNFSEYMALLSGNTHLFDKATLEKRIASLEGERKSFNKGKRDSEFKLESKTGELRNNTAFTYFPTKASPSYKQYIASTSFRYSLARPTRNNHSSLSPPLHSSFLY